MNMAKDEYYDANAYNEFLNVKDDILRRIESLREELNNLYGFDLRYTDVYPPNPYERILFIT